MKREKAKRYEVLGGSVSIYRKNEDGAMELVTFRRGEVFKASPNALPKGCMDLVKVTSIRGNASTEEGEGSTEETSPKEGEGSTEGEE